MNSAIRSRRLTIFSGVWHPNEGGAERQLRDVGNALTRIGWEVSVVAGAASATAAAAHDDGALSVRRVASRIGRPSGPTGWELLAGLTIAAQSTEPDVVLGSLAGAAPMAAMVFGRFSGAPRVLRIGGRDFTNEGMSARRMFDKFLVMGANLVVCNAPHLADQVTRLGLRGSPEIRVIRNGVTFHTDTTAQGPRTGPTRVLYYTNGGAAKNDVDFIRLVEACPGIRFRVVGASETLPWLPNLDRLGWLDDLLPQFAWSDAVVNTSTSEGSPNFCLQALAMGRPIVGFANEGILDLASQWPSDIDVVGISDVAAMASMLRNGQHRSRSVTAQVPTIDRVAEEWSRVLESLIFASD